MELNALRNKNSQNLDMGAYNLLIFKALKFRIDYIALELEKFEKYSIKLFRVPKILGKKIVSII